MTEESFYVKGRRGCAANVNVMFYDNSSAVASAEKHQITEHQLMVTLHTQYPNYNWSVALCGQKDYSAYWTVDGALKGKKNG